MDNPTIEPLPSNKNILIVLTVLVLLLLASTGFLGYQNWQLNQKLVALTKEATTLPSPNPAVVDNPDSTIRWKTYTNNTLGFAVKYPNDWYSAACGTDALLLNPKVTPACQGEPYEPIQFFSNAKVESEYDFFMRWGAEFQLTKMASSTNIGIEYTKYSVKKVGASPGPDAFILIRVPLKNGYFLIYNFDIQYEATADQILSTFKFTDAADDIHKLDKCVPATEGALKCYDITTREECQNSSPNCRWAVATP